MSDERTGLPQHVERLFPDHDSASLLLDEHRPFLIGRLLEEGDGRDLAWLVSRCGETRLRRWLERHGKRLLSDRSRAFWGLLLGLERTAAEENPLWPT